MDSTDKDLNKLVKDGWNPLANDSDAFRLAADLKINVMFLDWAVKAKLHNSKYETDWFDYDRFDGDVYAATRYAIVVAAAAIARNNVMV